MTTLAELMAQTEVHATWFWTHEVSTGSYSEYEVWNVVFVRDTHEPQKWVTSGDTRRTVYFEGIGGDKAGSRRETGGQRREPDAIKTLANLITESYACAQYADFEGWAEDYADPTASYESAIADFRSWSRRVKRHHQLREWLGEDYNAFLDASAAYLAGNDD